METGSGSYTPAQVRPGPRLAAQASRRRRQAPSTRSPYTWHCSRRGVCVRYLVHTTRSQGLLAGPERSSLEPDYYEPGKRLTEHNGAALTYAYTPRAGWVSADDREVLLAARRPLSNGPDAAWGGGVMYYALRAIASCMEARVYLRCLRRTRQPLSR